MTEDLKKRIQQLGYEMAARDRQTSQMIAAQRQDIDAKLNEISTGIGKTAQQQGIDAKLDKISTDIGKAAQQQGIDVKLDKISTDIADLQAAIAQLQTAAR